MSASKVSAAIRKGVVARIQSGRSTAAAEARKYGQKPATVRSWVHEAKGINELPATSTTANPTESDPTVNNEGVVSPLSATPSPVPSGSSKDPEALARARVAAGLPSPGAVASVANPSIEAAARAADEEDKRLVLDTYRDAKKGVVELLARRCGLDSGDPLVAAAAEPSSIVKTVLGANAGIIAPTIRGKLTGLPAIVGVLVFDAAVTMMAIRDVAIARGKAQEKTPPAPRPPQPVPQAA